ncbi:lasso peptide biosynthesis B2 protein [Sphingomonas koreensis]|nr:lasso peptide biosynthesis B2 protein [Sphingomonas koreensis]
MMTYRLRPDVSFCRLDGRLIFLDLSGDRYFCLSGACETAFEQLCSAQSLSADALAALQPMITTGMLVASGVGGPLQPCAPPPIAKISLYDDMRTASTWQTLQLARHLAWAPMTLRFRPLACILRQFEHRRARRAPRTTNQINHALRIAAALRRTEIVTSPFGRCLPRAIATAWRMLDDGVPPILVLAVKLAPFEAHSWVQFGDAVITDSLDNIRPFTPILVI